VAAAAVVAPRKRVPAAAWAAKAWAGVAAAAVAAEATAAVVAAVAVAEDDGGVAVTAAQVAWVAGPCPSAFFGKPKTSFGSCCCGRRSAGFGRVAAGG